MRLLTHLCLRSWLFACFVCFAGLLTSRQAAAQAGGGLITTTADTLVSGEHNGLPVEQLVGHVQFVQGSLYGSADRAYRYTTQNRIELTGNVSIHQDTLSLEAPLVTYDGNTHIGHAEGGVTLSDRDVTLTAASGDYDMSNQVAYFHNRVAITQGRSLSHSDELTYYRATQTSILTGNVNVVSDSGKLRATRVTYVKALDETTAEGGVVLSNDSLQLSSDWLYNSRPLGQMFSRGHVRVEDRKNHTILYGDTLARFSVTGYSVVPKSPILLTIDSSLQRDTATGVVHVVYDTMFVRSRLMETFQGGDSTRFRATDSVRILRGAFSGIGGKLYYDQKRDLMTISGGNRQRLWYDSTEIDADSVALTLKNRQIDRVYAVGHAFATDPVAEFPNSGRINQLQGERMMLVVEHDTARYLLDMSNALSIYFLVQNNREDGVNRASGDTIRIDFKGRSVSRLAVISGTEGEYFPERSVTGRAQLYRLTSFERHPELKPVRQTFTVPPSQSARTHTSPSPAVAPSPGLSPGTSPGTSPAPVKRNP